MLGRRGAEKSSTGLGTLPGPLVQSLRYLLLRNGCPLAVSPDGRRPRRGAHPFGGLDTNRAPMKSPARVCNLAVRALARVLEFSAGAESRYSLAKVAPTGETGRTPYTALSPYELLRSRRKTHRSHFLKCIFLFCFFFLFHFFRFHLRLAPF